MGKHDLPDQSLGDLGRTTKASLALPGDGSASRTAFEEKVAFELGQNSQHADTILPVAVLVSMLSMTEISFAPLASTSSTIWSR
jgi:hypothetical protein